MDADLLDLGESVLDEGDDKFRVTVEYEGREHSVSWYRGLESKDIEDAILCACDSIVDQGFTLNDCDGFPVPLGQVVPGCKYYLVPGTEIQGKENVMGNRFRRISVEIEPLKHLEALRAIELIKSGSNLLKHTRNSSPHIRLFQVTDDLKYVLWYSSGKSQQKSSILIENISFLQCGQKTDNFMYYPIPSLEHLSFSIIHTQGTLDLTCRDEREYDLWLIGLKALNFRNKELKVSKQVLLSHSRRFSEYLRANKFSSATQVIYNEAESKRLEECIARKSLNKEEISEKLVKIHKKLTRIAEKLIDLPSEFQAYNLGQGSLDAYGGEYLEIGLEDCGTDEIFHCEQHRLRDLNEKCQSQLIQLETEFSSKFLKGGQTDTSAFETSLWCLEIDVENLSDIVNRVEKVTGEKWGKKLKNWFGGLF